MADNIDPYCCPGCRYSNRIQRVPALYADGFGTSYHDSVVVGSAGGHLMTGVAVGRTTTVSALASALSPQPLVKKGGWLTALGVGWLLFLLIPAAVEFSTHAQAGAVSGQRTESPWAIAAGIYLIAGWWAALCIVFGLRRSARRARVARGITRASLVWNEGWYCHRCGYCYFPPTAEPLGVPTGTLLDTGQFRHVVWTAGGYAGIGA